MGLLHLSLDFVQHLLHPPQLLIFLSDQPLSFWICPWWDSRDGEVGTTLSSQFAEGEGKGELVRLGAPQHLRGLSPELVEEQRKGSVSPKTELGIPTLPALSWLLAILAISFFHHQAGHALDALCPVERTVAARFPNWYN